MLNCRQEAYRVRSRRFSMRWGSLVESRICDAKVRAGGTGGLSRVRMLSNGQLERGRRPRCCTPQVGGARSKTVQDDAHTLRLMSLSSPQC